MSAKPNLEALRAMLAFSERGELRSEGSERERSGFQERPKTLPLGLYSVDAALPEGGLPRGAVVELASPRGLGRSTTLALAACASAQSLARLRSGNPRTVGAWCAFLDPWSTLHASGALGSGVDLSRLLVVRPPLDALARVAIRVASSRAFSVVVIDTASLPGAGVPSSGTPRASSGDRRTSARVDLDRWGTIVRRLALVVERADTTVLLLTDAHARRSMPLPVAMRIELDRALVASGHDWAACSPSSTSVSVAGSQEEESLRDVASLRIAKDRRGRVTSAMAITFERTKSSGDASIPADWGGRAVPQAS